MYSQYKYTRITCICQYTFCEYYIIFLVKDMKLKIRDIREDKDLTQKQLAQVLGTTQQTYSRYETGEIIIDIFSIVKLSEFYNTSVDYLLGLTDEIKPYKRN